MCDQSLSNKIVLIKSILMKEIIVITCLNASNIPRDDCAFQFLRTKINK